MQPIIDVLILTLLALIYRQGIRMAKKSDEIVELLNQVDEATNEVASDLERLRDEVDNGISPADAETFKARLSGHAARLRVLGSDPENPVPPVA